MIKIIKANLKKYNEVEEMLFEDEYLMYKDIFENLSNKIFYELDNEKYLPVDTVEDTRKDIEKVYEELKSFENDSELALAKKEKDRLLDDKNIADLIEEYELVVLPSYILDII